MRIAAYVSHEEAQRDPHDLEDYPVHNFGNQPDPKPRVMHLASDGYAFLYLLEEDRLARRANPRAFVLNHLRRWEGFAALQACGVTRSRSRFAGLSPRPPIAPALA